eukprot:scaffold2819_cov285-Chaetoceros_neogracile.AAC.1
MSSAARTNLTSNSVQLHSHEILGQGAFRTAYAADKAIQYAEDWNTFCESDEIILITTRGDVHTIGGRKYLVEPLIRNFTKFTSNNGWISDNEGWHGEALEAYSHYTYHRSGGNMIVCDLQGRHRGDRFKKSKSRLELTDVANMDTLH